LTSSRLAYSPRVPPLLPIGAEWGRIDGLPLSIGAATSFADGPSYLGLHSLVAVATLSPPSRVLISWALMPPLDTALWSWRVEIRLGMVSIVVGPDYPVLQWRELLEKGFGWDLF
jgi:hypothetical protein